MNVCIHDYVYLRICVFVNMCVGVSMCMKMCICEFFCLNMCIYEHVIMNMCILDMCIYEYVYYEECVFVNVCACTFIHSSHTTRCHAGFCQTVVVLVTTREPLMIVMNEYDIPIPYRPIQSTKQCIQMNDNNLNSN